MSNLTLRAKSRILGLKEDPQAPTDAGETFTVDAATGATLISRGAAEEMAGDDLLEQAEEAEESALKLRAQAAQVKGAAEAADLTGAAAADQSAADLTREAAAGISGPATDASASTTLAPSK